MFKRFSILVLTAACVLGPSMGSTSVRAQRAIPHNQDRPPNPALSPTEAAARMTVPPGFHVEVVACEPDLVNPVAMTFDERGRIWVTESLEYPRHTPGPGRDRVKILEDTDHDGRVDKVRIFAEGLNIPSGIAVGHGGVWVANAPDLLFLQDTDGDDRADRAEVVVTGFGRDDTHELPNSLSWGPDGWLYGWNGVFNRSRIVHRGRTFEFTCALFRIHPRTREFQLFSEGTSNPWGVTWDDEGSAFASACVIDHLWNLCETGYYHRQGGPYPPFTWKIGSIVDHLHQKAAYCGIHYYDSDAYPAEYRGKLFMGNIHGNCVNVDGLKRNGSTYRGVANPDFLQANDAWFMPVSQKTGPDGSLYILDWYDRYHCYQDANRDPAGIDRLKGRLYRIRHGDTPRRGMFDLGWKTDAELVTLLGGGNGFDRETARRLLIERTSPRIDESLKQVVFDATAPRRTRMNALWTLVSRDGVDTAAFLKLLDEKDAGFRAWAIRAAGNRHSVDPAVQARIAGMVHDPSPDVRLQLAIAAVKVNGLLPIDLLTEIAATSGDDPVIPQVVWQNLQPRLDEQGRAFLTALDRLKPAEAGSPAILAIVSRALERVLGGREADGRVVGVLLRRVLLSDGSDPTAQRRALEAIAARFDATHDAPDLLVRQAIDEARARQPRGELHDDLTLLAAFWKAPESAPLAIQILTDRNRPMDLRLRAVSALRVAVGEERALDQLRRLILDRPAPATRDFRGRLIGALGPFEDPKVAALVLEAYPGLEPDLKPRAIELLSQRASWAKALFHAIGAGKVEPSALNVNQVRRMLVTGDAELAALVKARWGVLREGRDPAREQVIERMRRLIRNTPGDPVLGVEIFKRLCAQCHKLHGDGQEVGPEITLNGRASLDQLLSNVFDPSLVIGAAYQGTVVATTDGRVLTGLLVEDSPTQVVLRLQGGKLETISRGQVEAKKLSPLSLMPEDVERQLKPQEIADLFAYISLDRPPGDPKARSIPGAEGLRRERRSP